MGMMGIKAFDEWLDELLWQDGCFAGFDGLYYHIGVMTCLLVQLFSIWIKNRQD